MWTFSKATLLAAALAVLASPVAAQQQPGPRARMMGEGPMMGGPGMMGPGMMGGPGMMMMHSPMMPGMGPGAMMFGPGRHIEGRIAFLKAELGITPAQEQAWNTFAEALRESAASMQAMHDQMMAGGMPGTLPERVEWHEQMMAARLDALKALRAALGPLYEALSPEQKQIADSLIGMM